MEPSVKEGVRCVVEAIYDPPQKSDFSGQTELPDKRRPAVEQIAASLGLEHVGIIFTKVDQDTFLTEKEVKRAAKM